MHTNGIRAMAIIAAETVAAVVVMVAAEVAMAQAPMMRHRIEATKCR